jgi:hypothetical protein
MDFADEIEAWKKAIDKVAWHETGHAVYAILKGVKVTKVKIRMRNSIPYGGETWFAADMRERWLMGNGFHIAGRAWEVRYNGETVESVVDAMMAEKGKGTDRELLGNPSREELIGMVNKCLEETERDCQLDIVKKLNEAIHEGLWHKSSLNHKDLQAIGKETGWLIK